MGEIYQLPAQTVNGSWAVGTLADQAYERIRDDLVTLKIPPGAAISEDDLMRELGMGRTPVREALRRCALEDLVDVFPRRGTFAADINITDLADISDVRRLLEGHAAGLAATRLTPAHREQLEALRAELARESGSGAELMDLDARVHRFIYVAAGNPFLQATLDRYLNLSLRIWHLAINRVPGLSSAVEQHADLLDAIRDGDAAQAQTIASAHVTLFERDIRKVL